MRHEVIKLYENREDITLTTYLHEYSEEMLSSASRPAIIVCPGGAYVFCSEREAEPVALRFSSMGYQAFTLKYSVYNKGEYFDIMQDDLPKDENSLFPNAMCDLGAAVLYIKDHAEELLIDPEQIFVCGFSAGANNCAVYCTKWHENILSDRYGRPAEDFRVAGAILGYGYYNWGTFCADNQTVPALKKFADAGNVAFFGVKNPGKEQIDECNAIMAVNGNTPPMFLWTTCEDSILPSEQTLELGAALAKAGVPCEVHAFEKGEHGLANADESTACDTSQINDEAAIWVSFAHKWLRRHSSFNIQEPGEVLHL